MNNITIEEKYVLEYISDMLSSFKTKSVQVNNAHYHHNTSYSNTPIILRHGILCLSELNKQGIKKFSKNQLDLYSDIDSHINGINSISLAVVGLTDLYSDEFEYNPFSATGVDLNISSDIRVRRAARHYGNEFLCDTSIGIDKIKAIDIRLLELIQNCPDFSIKEKINLYNILREIALTIKQKNIDIPLREMSSGDMALDIDKIVDSPKLILK